MTMRGYVLIETADGQAGDIGASVGHGLANCLALGHAFQPSELVVHLECTELKDFQKAILDDLARRQGVKRITPVAIVPDAGNG